MTFFPLFGKMMFAYKLLEIFICYIENQVWQIIYLIVGHLKLQIVHWDRSKLPNCLALPLMELVVRFINHTQSHLYLYFDRGY